MWEHQVPSKPVVPNVDNVSYSCHLGTLHVERDITTGLG